MMKDKLQIASPDADPFNLRKRDFSVRVPEPSEMFSEEDARLYIAGCDFPETADYLLPALRVQEQFGNLRGKRILDAMSGPGNLGRELLRLGTRQMVFHDGDPVMLNHARKKAEEIKCPGQQVQTLCLPVDRLRPADSFDLVVCQNSAHQLSSLEKLGRVIAEFVHITRPGGRVMIFDYQRGTAPRFLTALEERLKSTKQEIVPLLIPTFQAAFSRHEFEDVISSIPRIRSWSVTDARMPVLTDKLKARVEADPVRGHVLDRSPISLEIIIEKGR